MNRPMNGSADGGTSHRANGSPGPDTVVALAPAGSDLWSSLEVLRRHWVVVVAGLVLTAIASITAIAVVGPVYQAKGSVILLVPTAKSSDTTSSAVSTTAPPTTAPKSNQTTAAGAPVTTLAVRNPYLDFGNSLQITAAVVASVMVSDGRASQILETVPGGSFTVDAAKNDTPMLDIVGSGPNAEVALQTEAAVVNAVRDELLRVQTNSGAPVSSFITVTEINKPDHADIVRTNRIRALAMILVLGLSATLGIAFLAEGRRQRKHGFGAPTAQLIAAQPVALESAEHFRRPVPDHAAPERERPAPAPEPSPSAVSSPASGRQSLFNRAGRDLDNLSEVAARRRGGSTHGRRS
jgi:capsular polysaccharide biosynthesis protein